MKTILLATDGSPSARKATDVAIELAGALDATLRIVSVWRLPLFDYGYVPVQYAPEITRAQEEGAEAALEHAAAAAKAAGIGSASELRHGFAADEICAAADEAAADMIVIGAHGWGAAKRLLFGSVSTTVLHHATCPVLIVRGEREEDERERERVSMSTAGSLS